MVCTYVVTNCHCSFPWNITLTTLSGEMFPTDVSSLCLGSIQRTHLNNVCSMLSRSCPQYLQFGIFYLVPAVQISSEVVVSPQQLGNIKIHVPKLPCEPRFKVLYQTSGPVILSLLCPTLFPRLYRPVPFCYYRVLSSHIRAPSIDPLALEYMKIYGDYACYH